MTFLNITHGMDTDTGGGSVIVSTCSTTRPLDHGVTANSNRSSGIMCHIFLMSVLSCTVPPTKQTTPDAECDVAIQCGGMRWNGIQCVAA